MDMMERAHGALTQESDGDLDGLNADMSSLKGEIRQYDRQLIKRIKGGRARTRQSLLFLGTMSKTERIADQTVLLARLYRETIKNLRD